MALFLFGMYLMGDGLKRVAGNRLEIVLYRLTSTPLKGVLLGTGVTAVIQSSSATSVMVVGFVNSGMMKVRQAIGIVMGAILGTSVTGWILCLSDIGGGSASGWVQIFSTATLTGIIAVVGIILQMFTKNQTKQHVGGIMLGFAVLMYGMQAMSSAVAPLKESAAFIGLITTFSNPLIGILAGILVTSVIQSSSAAVGILQALAITGAIDFSVAYPLILGIAIGAAVPVLLSAVGATTDGKRTAFIYLLVDVLGVLIWGSIFYIVNAAVGGFSFMSLTMTTVSVAFVNTLFRFVTVLVLTPFIGKLEKLVDLFIKDKPDARRETEDFNRLEERFVDHPALAIEQSRLTINSMARRAQENLYASIALLGNYTDDGFQRVKDSEDAIDGYEDKLGTYLVKVTAQELADKQNEDVSKFLHTISDFERISDHALNIAELAQEIHEKNMRFSPAASHELTVLQGAVTEVLSTAVEAFISNDMDTAYHVEPLEELIDNLCDEMKLHHIERVQKGICTLTQGFVFNDLLTNYERVSDHCSNIAVAMIELESDMFETHSYLDGVKEMHSHSFDRYYEEFSKKYSL
ncbi:MAG TPA: Na/Pi cotransporter family protein [Oscillospiraceae bacterium]|nr:Na/Pi cotransporter family protein [Oscillospiraceae bacterium]